MFQTIVTRLWFQFSTVYKNSGVIELLRRTCHPLWYFTILSDKNDCHCWLYSSEKKKKLLWLSCILHGRTKYLTEKVVKNYVGLDFWWFYWILPPPHHPPTPPQKKVIIKRRWIWIYSISLSESLRLFESSWVNSEEWLRHTVCIYKLLSQLHISNEMEF